MAVAGGRGRTGHPRWRGNTVATLSLLPGLGQQNRRSGATQILSRSARLDSSRPRSLRRNCPIPLAASRVCNFQGDRPRGWLGTVTIRSPPPPNYFDRCRYDVLRMCSRLTRRETNVPGQPQPGECADNGITEIQLPPSQSVPGRRRKRMVAVMPSLSKPKQAKKNIVPALISASEWPEPPQVACRVDAPGHVVDEKDASEPPPNMRPVQTPSQLPLTSPPTIAGMNRPRTIQNGQMASPLVGCGSW